MKNYLHIPLAVLLIVLGIWGCLANRPQLLTECLPETPWTDISWEGAEIAVAEEDLNALLADTVIFPGPRSAAFAGSTLTFTIRYDAQTCQIRLGEEGIISVSGPERKTTFWRNAGSVLYQKLVPSP